jgi:Subtilase family
VLEPPQRRATSSRYGRSPKHDDAASHGSNVAKQARAITIQHIGRKPVLGVDPRLVFVFEFHAQVDPDELRRAGLLLLDGSRRHAVVAFADDPELASFHERLAAYSGPIPDGQKGASYQAFFDSIVSIRVLGPQDRISQSCAGYVAALSAPEELRLDVACWHPDNIALANQWVEDLRTAAKAAGGRVASVYTNHPAGVILARIYLPSDRLTEFASLDVICTIDLLPKPELRIGQLFGLQANDLPTIRPAFASSPILGLIDSGVMSGHPLLEGAVLQAESFSPHIVDGEDRNGHGTLVASIALHGNIDQAINRNPLIPIARIVSVAVLDSDSLFPDDSLWESDLADAVKYCAEQGARVINLSIGDPRVPFKGPRQLSASAVIDQLARQYGLVIVAAAGNIHPSDYLPGVVADSAEYIEHLLAHAEAGLTAPGSAALALTVGGIASSGVAGAYTSIEAVERKAHGRAGWPSAISRIGPGIGGAIKPELVQPSGTMGFDPTHSVVEDNELKITGAGTANGRLLAKDIGTSFAAPAVSRVALAILARYPEFPANLVRALTLLGAERTWDGSELVVTGPAKRAAALRRMMGFGTTSIDGALTTHDHRAILVAESSIVMDGLHIYELPMPNSFFESGGSRVLDIALTHDPPTKLQRLDYMGNKLEFYVVKGMTIDEVATTFAKFDLDETDDGEDDVEESADGLGADSAIENDGTQPVKKDPQIGDLKSKRVKLDTSVKVLSLGCNQRASRTLTVRLTKAEAPWHIVIRSVNRWCDDTMKQDYALAVSLRRDEDRTEILADLAARLEAIVEVRTEVEAETEIEL